MSPELDDRLKVKQLGSVRGEIEIEPLVVQVIAGALVGFLPEQVLHRPVVRREVLDG